MVNGENFYGEIFYEHKIKHCPLPIHHCPFTIAHSPFTFLENNLQYVR